MLAGHKAINPGEKLYTNVHGVTIHRDDLMKINDEDFVSEFFRAAGLLRKLNLNDTDIALLKGITLLSRGEYSCLVFPFCQRGGCGVGIIDNLSKRSRTGSSQNFKQNIPLIETAFQEALPSTAAPGAQCDVLAQSFQHGVAVCKQISRL